MKDIFFFPFFFFPLMVSGVGGKSPYIFDDDAAEGVRDENKRTTLCLAAGSKCTEQILGVSKDIVLVSLLPEALGDPGVVSKRQDAGLGKI